MLCPLEMLLVTVVGQEGAAGGTAAGLCLLQGGESASSLQDLLACKMEQD